MKGVVGIAVLKLLFGHWFQGGYLFPLVVRWSVQARLPIFTRFGTGIAIRRTQPASGMQAFRRAISSTVSPNAETQGCDTGTSVRIVVRASAARWGQVGQEEGGRGSVGSSLLVLLQPVRAVPRRMKELFL